MLHPIYAQCTTNETLTSIITLSFAKCLGIRKPNIGAGMKDDKSLRTPRLDAAGVEDSKVKRIAGAAAQATEQQKDIVSHHHRADSLVRFYDDFSDTAPLHYAEKTLLPSHVDLPSDAAPAFTDAFSSDAGDYCVLAVDEECSPSTSPLREHLASCLHGAAKITFNLRTLLHSPFHLR